MERTNLTRVFMYSGVRLPDPDPAMNPIAVRDLFATAGRPELSNAEVRGPEIVGNEAQYTLHRAVGTKGAKADKKAKAIQETLARFEEGMSAVYKQRQTRIAEKSSKLLQAVSRSGDRPMAAPTPAIPWML